MLVSSEQFPEIVRFAALIAVVIQNSGLAEHSWIDRVAHELKGPDLIACVLTFSVATSAEAHRSWSDQDYSKYRQKNGASCCDGRGCRPVDYFVRPDGSVIMFPDRQGVVVKQGLLNEKPSDDGRAHWCGIVTPGASPITFCAILPRQMTRWKRPSAPTRLLREFTTGWNQTATPAWIPGFTCRSGR